MPAEHSFAPGALQIGGIDIRDVAGCTCLRLRKATRRVTQIYEHYLDAAEVTIGQFGVLGHLFGARAMTGVGLPMGDLALRLGVDPTTLKRTLGPLVANCLVEAHADESDRRVKLVAITEAGCQKLQVAMPRWQQAQHALRELIGVEMKETLNKVTDETMERIALRADDLAASVEADRDEAPSRRKSRGKALS